MFLEVCEAQSHMFVMQVAADFFQLPTVVISTVDHHIGSSSLLSLTQDRSLSETYNPNPILW
jgi:hypothetical protein